MPEKMTVTVRGVPLEVEYTVTDHGDILTHEIWVAGIEMISLLDDRFLCQIRDEIARRLADGKATLP